MAQDPAVRIHADLFFPAIFLTGCLGGISNNLGDGRMEAWKEVELAREETKQELLNTKQCEMEAREGKTQNPTLKITTKDSAGKDVIVEMDLEPTIAAATGHNGRNNTYGIEVVPTTAIPEGIVAETIKSTATPIKEVLHAPATLVLATGAAIYEGISAAGGGSLKINADRVNMSDSNNRTDVHASGSGNTFGASISTSESTDITEIDPVGTGTE